MRPIQNGLSAILGTAAAWGVWPACIMLLCQLEVARIAGETYPLAIAAVTCAGTLGIYFADRLLERLMLENLEARHSATSRDYAFPLVVLAILALAYPGRNAVPLHWLALLTSMGLLYIAVTTQVVRTPILLKEALGGWIFALLIFDWVPGQPLALSLAFLPLAMANFLFSSHQDRGRDEANGMRSLAVLYPLANLGLARILAMFTAGFFFQYVGLTSIFFWIALAHALWPPRLHVDAAFLPLLAAPLLYFF